MERPSKFWEELGEAHRRDETSTTRLSEPSLGWPLPVKWKGRLVSQDLANSSIEVDAVWRALRGSAPQSILEIGAGYGRTADDYPIPGRWEPLFRGRAPVQTDFAHAAWGVPGSRGPGARSTLAAPVDRSEAP